MNTHSTETILPLTDHAVTRMNQRGVREEQIRLAIAHGEETYRNGSIHYFVGERLVRERMRRDGLDLRACKNVHVVVSIDTGVVITAYVNSASRRTRSEHRHSPVPANPRRRRGTPPSEQLAYAMLESQDTGFACEALIEEAEAATRTRGRICPHKRGSYRGFAVNN